MSELRLTGKNPEGTHITLTNASGDEFTVRISDTLRATVNQPRLTAVVATDEEQVMSVKEIQRRLRAGESMDAIARDGQISVEKVERFAGPILQERVYILDQAFAVVMRKESARDQESFNDVVTARLAPMGVDSQSLTWNTWRIDDGTWTIDLSYPNRDGHGSATWNFDLNRRSITATNENARWMLGQDPAPRTQTPGLVHAEPSHPSRIVDSLSQAEIQPEPVRATPRLVAIRETPREEDRAEGIAGRAKVPSWDEIMFGRTATPATSSADLPDNDPFEDPSDEDLFS
ncbi:MAG: septation protein SepH [Candidatus Planktophila sp.]